MADYPISKSQARVLALLGIEHDGTDHHATALLLAAGLPANGIPAGCTPHAARKLGDAELLAALPRPIASATEAATVGAAVVAKERAEQQQRRAEYRERQRAIRDYYNSDEYRHGPREDDENLADELAAVSGRPRADYDPAEVE